MELDSDLLNEFVAEAKGHIAEIELGLLRLEEIEADEDTINKVFRAAHTIKGTASFFGLHKIVDLAHVIETIFAEFREHRLNVNPEMSDVLLAAADLLKELVSNPENSEKYDITNEVEAIRRFLDPGKNKVVKTTAGALSAWELWDQLTSSEEATAEAAAPIGDDALLKPAGQVAANNDGAQRQEAVPHIDKVHKVVMEDNVRVSVGLLNDLLNLAGEMVLRRNQLLRIAQEPDRQALQLAVVAKSIDELTTNLQKKVMKTRMQPISNVFNKFPRIIRDLSRKIGKEVDLTMQGLDVELDRSLIEALVDPMTHLVRNALDHGIETPEVRGRMKKPPAGSIVLRAYHESGRVIVDICDDGAGINLDKVKAKAIEKGIVGEKELNVLGEADIMNLILSPGFSTAEKITDLSGRGVGMDVVKTNIEKLGGKIEIISELGVGTTFRLILPLTLAIVPSFIVVANGQSFAIPQANVRELLLIRPDEKEEKRIEMLQQRPVLRLRGNLLPVVSLGGLLENENGIADMDPSAYCDQNIRLLVIKSGRGAYGLIVDSVYDTEELLVKPLSAALGSCGLYSGVTVLGDGRIAMILDTENMKVRAGISPTEESFQPADARIARTVAEEKQYILLFKCSGGEMLGLDMAMVSRVEEVNIDRLHKIGSKYYFSFQGKSIRVIRPEHYLPIAKRKNKPEKVYIILPKMMKQAVGLIAEEIYDAVYTNVSLDDDGVCGTGIVGSALIDGTLVVLLNIHELYNEAVPEYYSRVAVGAAGGYNPGKIGESCAKTILLAEDTPFFLKIVKSYLESDGYNVVIAENGREALEVLTRTAVDAVVSDIEMPIMNGIELVRAIRADTNLRDLPVLALTSLTGEANKEKGLRAGFDIYQNKLDRTKLLESIRELLLK